MELPWRRFLALSCFCLLAATAKADDIKFEKEKIILGGKTITVELAKTESQHQQGLMFRKMMPENEGMLFIFNEEQPRHFWMKNTLIDLSIGYFDSNKVLIDMQEMRSASVLETRPPSYTSAKPAMYALEMNKGWFTRNKIKVGQKFEFQKR